MVNSSHSSRTATDSKKFKSVVNHKEQNGRASFFSLLDGNISSLQNVFYFLKYHMMVKVEKSSNSVDTVTKKKLQTAESNTSSRFSHSKNPKPHELI
jgi:hypothetical protein